MINSIENHLHSHLRIPPEMIEPALGIYRRASKQSIRLTLSDLLDKGIQIPKGKVNLSHSGITPATIISYSIKLPKDKRLPIGHAVFPLDYVNHLNEAERNEIGQAIFYFEPKPRLSAKNRLAYLKAFSLDEMRFFPLIELHNVEYQTRKPYSRENRHIVSPSHNDSARLVKDPDFSRRWSPGFI